MARPFEGIRIIDQYNVDWILQDGQNMVKQCTKTTHTHDPNDSNYANAVDGLNAVVSAIQAARPNVYWENCENGGSMMTFNMVKSYVTSITNDASGSLASRRAVYGATYPFPPRFAERYMPGSDGLDSYSTGSYMFGGPWVLMNRLADLTPDLRKRFSILATVGALVVAVDIDVAKARITASNVRVGHVCAPVVELDACAIPEDGIDDRGCTSAAPRAHTRAAHSSAIVVQ